MDKAPGWLIAVVVAWMLASFIPSIILIARRAHDFNASGKRVLATFIPYLGMIAALVIGVIPGTRGENDKGYDPRQPFPEQWADAFE